MQALTINLSKFIYSQYRFENGINGQYENIE